MKGNTMIDDNMVLKLLGSLVNGERDDVPESLLQLMDVTDDGLIRWIPFHMQASLGWLNSLTGSVVQLTAELRCHLNAIVSLLSTFKDAKTGSGEAWEALFVLILLVRALTGQAHPLLGTDEIAKHTRVAFNEPHKSISAHKLEDFVGSIPQKLESGPQISVYYPRHASFPLYDCFLVAWNTEGQQSHLIGYQLKQGKGLPRHNPSQLISTSYLIRGAAVQSTGAVRDWVTQSSVELNEFFGVSGKLWTPEKWKVLVESDHSTTR
jgi:hypothetical protein